MAIIAYDPNLDENQKRQTNEAKLPGSNPGQQTPETEATDQAQKSRGAGYTNLSKYLEANKERGTELGQKLRDTVAESVGGAREAISSFTRAAEQEQDTNRIEDQVGDLDSMSSEQIQGKLQPDKTPTSYAMSEDQRQKVHQAEQDLALARTSEGRSQLLKDRVVDGGPTYSRGQQRLDAALMSRADNPIFDLLNQNSSFATVQDTEDQITSRAADIQTHNDQMSQQYQEAVEQRLLDIWDSLDDKVAAQEQTYDQANQEFLARIRSGDFSGLDPQEQALLAIAQSRGYNPGSFVSMGKTDVDYADVASAQDLENIQKYGDLMRLLGMDGGQTSEQIHAANQDYNHQAAINRDSIEALLQDISLDELRETGAFDIPDPNSDIWRAGASVRNRDPNWEQEYVNRLLGRE